MALLIDASALLADGVSYLRIVPLLRKYVSNNDTSVYIYWLCWLLKWCHDILK